MGRSPKAQPSPAIRGNSIRFGTTPADPNARNLVNAYIRALSIALLLGMVLLAAPALVHPVLGGAAADQLRMISDTPYWRTMHLSMLAGSGLIIAGIWVRLVTDLPATAQPSAAGARPTVNLLLLGALALISLGTAVNALNIGFMAGAGWHMAAEFAAGRTEMAPVFEGTHPIGLIAARFGNFIVSLGALGLGWAEWQDMTRPRWLAWLAWGAGIGGLIGVFFFNEASRIAVAAVALLMAWELATAFRALRSPGVVRQST
jgi:hypothetical protein